LRFNFASQLQIKYKPNQKYLITTNQILGKTFHICNIMGIPLKVHWSFGLTVLFVAYMISLNNLSVAASIGFALLTLVMFICVILHELGHCMAARRYGIDTLDIIISPIGGLARLKNIPEQPVKELVIALAGPAVNVIIAILIGIYLHFILLSFKLERVLATRVAMWIARLFAIGFVLLASYSNNITLGVIGAFVYIMSGREYANVKAIKKISLPISKVYRSNFTRINIDDNYDKVLSIYKNGKEKNFLVFDYRKIKSN